MSARRATAVVLLPLLLVAGCLGVSTRSGAPPPSPSPAPVPVAPARALAASSPPSAALVAGAPPHRTTRAAPGGSAGSVRVPAADPPMSWRFPAGQDHGVQGFADRTSIAPGEPLRLFVSTASPSFVVRAFRMGWYGGALGRETWVSAAIRGGLQPAAVRTGPSRLDAWKAPWSPSVVVRTRGWQPGMYLLRLDTAQQGMGYVPVTVRAPSAAGRVVLVSAVTTWQAYNTWGGANLYAGPDKTFATRSRAVSFDRPYVANAGSGEFIDRELPVLAQAERLGLPLQYVTDIDLHQHPSAVAGAAAIVSMGHDEYYSPAMRAALTRARDGGTNLAFFGANAVFRRIRLAATSLGPDRLEVNYKIAAEDPLDAVNSPRTTADWPSPPHPDPESSLIGAQYACFPGPQRVAGVVADPSSWVFAGTGVRRGTQLPGLVGPEIDAVQLQYPTPRPIDVLLHSPDTCAGAPAYADATYYVAPSGAGVFDAGTIDWACDAGGGCHASGPTGRVVRTVTDNVLRAFATSRAGWLHPAHDDLAALGLG